MAQGSDGRFQKASKYQQL
uniref:Uncharacterized protein n=1 Tax=Rhizophora mucronata TaxID=61149 RepID=A0A2P2IJD9_RHIMU